MKGVSLLPPSQTMTSASCSARERMARVVDPGEDEVALGEVRLVLLALLDRAVGRVEVLVALEALDGLLRQVAVGHRVAEDGDALARLAEQPRRRSASSGSCRSRCARHRWRRPASRSADHRRARPQQPVVGPGRHGQRADVHHVLVRDVRVGEDDFVHVLAAHEVGQLLLGQDRDPVRIARAGQRGRVDAALDVRDLRRREGDHLDVVAPAEGDVEVVEVAAGCAGDDDPASSGYLLLDSLAHRGQLELRPCHLVEQLGRGRAADPPPRAP